MKIHKIYKGSKVRTVYALNSKELYYNLQFTKELQQLCLEHCDHEVVHGFMPLRSAVSNARSHIGYNYSLVNDLANFFDYIKVDHIKHIIKNDKLIENCFFEGAPRQGFPTSPLIANLAAVALDNRIKSSIISLDRVVYTRYADDLTISFDDKDLLSHLREVVATATQESGFSLNKSKSHLYGGTNGEFRSVTGISVGEFDIQPSRRLKRKLRAARHQNNQATVRGLEEFMSFKSLGI